MWEAIKDDPKAKEKFIFNQLQQMEKGSRKIQGYTWHHNAQSSPHNMQLVPEAIHDKTAVPHTGQVSLSEGK